MNAKVAYSLSALFLLLATTLGILAVTSPAHALYYGEMCWWDVIEYPDTPYITSVDCTTWQSSSCWEECMEEEEWCEESCDGHGDENACINECWKVGSACRRACTPIVK